MKQMVWKIYWQIFSYFIALVDNEEEKFGHQIFPLQFLPMYVTITLFVYYIRLDSVYYSIYLVNMRKLKIVLEQLYKLDLL